MHFRSSRRGWCVIRACVGARAYLVFGEVQYALRARRSIRVVRDGHGPCTVAWWDTRGPRLAFSRRAVWLRAG